MILDMERRILLLALLCILKTASCRRIQLSPEEASKITRRDISEDEFNKGTSNFVAGAVKVPGLVQSSGGAPKSRSIEEIKRELERVWRELHVSSSQPEGHSILPKNTKKSVSKEANNAGSKEGELRRRSSRMEKLEGIVDNLINELESEGRENRQISSSKIKKAIDSKHLQKDIEALLQVSDEFKRGARDFKRQKLNGIGRTVQNNNAGEALKQADSKRESHKLNVKDILTRLIALNQKRSQQEENLPPKITGFGREMSATEAFSELVKSYLKEKMKRTVDTAATRTDKSMVARETTSNGKAEVLATKEGSKRSFDKLIDFLSSRLVRGVLSPPALPMKTNIYEGPDFSRSRHTMSDVREKQSPPMLPKKDPKSSREMLDKSERIALLKRAIKLMKFQRSIPIFTKSRQSDEQSELKEVKSLQGQSKDVRLAELKRRVAAMRLLNLYRKAQSSQEDILERELASVAHDRFAADSDRFATNRADGKGPKTSVTGTSTGHVQDFNSLLDLHGDGVSHETVKTLKGFHKPDTREVRNPPQSQISPETSSSLAGFDRSEN